MRCHSGGLRVAKILRLGIEMLLWPFPVRISNFEARFDRLDLDAKSTSARVIDYKTGRCPDGDPGLDNGKELQRCLYAVAVKALLGQVTAVEAALLYPGSEGNLYSLSDPVCRPRNSYASFNSPRRCFGWADASSARERRAATTTWPLPFPQTLRVWISQKAAARDVMAGDLSNLWGTGM